MKVQIQSDDQVVWRKADKKVEKFQNKENQESKGYIINLSRISGKRQSSSSSFLSYHTTDNQNNK